MQFVQHRVLGYDPYINRVCGYFLPNIVILLLSHMLKTSHFGQWQLWQSAQMGSRCQSPAIFSSTWHRKVYASRFKRSNSALVPRTAAQLHPSCNDWEKDLLAQEDSGTNQPWFSNFQSDTITQIFLQFILQPLILKIVSLYILHLPVLLLQNNYLVFFKKY